MNSKAIALGILKALGVTLGFLLLIYFLWEIQEVLLYIGIAAVIALIGRPVVNFLNQRLHFPNQLAVVTVLILVMALITCLVSLFFPIIIDQAENIRQFDLTNFKSDLQELNVQVKQYLGVNQLDLIEGFKQTGFVENFDVGLLSQLMNTIFSSLGTALIGIFSVVFISFFLLKDSTLMLNSVLAFSNRGQEERFKNAFAKIKNLLSRYFVGLFFQILLLFVIYTIILVVFNIDNPVAAAFICAFLNIVPYLGPTIAGVLMMLFVVTTNLGSDFSSVILPKIIYVMSGYAIAQLIDNLISQPLIFSRSVKSHPLEIFLIILISGLLFNVLGMILAIPFYTAMKVIAKEAFSKYKVVDKLTRNM